MTNREKYRFDDFTLENYKNLIELSINSGFEFISFTDTFYQGRKDIL